MLLLCYAYHYCGLLQKHECIFIQTFSFQALRDHYNNLCSLQKVYCEEFIPFIDISRSNKRRLGKTEDPGETRDMMQETLEEIVGEGGNDMMEIMATSVLPRFNRYIEA